MSVDKVTKSDVEDALAYFKIKCDAEYLPADAVATKLYDDLGTATDGAVNQATVTEELAKKIDSDTVTAELSKKLDSDATAVKATKLETARSLKVSLSSGAAQTFDGSSDANQIGVAGTLPVANGGTGKTNLSEVTVGKATQLETARNIQTNLASTTAGSFNGTASVSAGVTGTLGIANGGTGQTTAAGVRNTLGLGNTTGALPIANGGTGANAVAGARQNLFGDNMNTAALAKYVITINDNWVNGGYTTVQQLRNFMGLGNTTGALPVANGGTGQTNLNDVTVGRATNDGAGNNIASTYVPKALSQSLEALCWLPYAGAGSPDQADLLKFNLLKSGFYSAVCQTNTQIFVSNANNNWLNVLNCRHDNACTGGDTTRYGMLIYSPMTVAGNLYWRQQYSGNWQAEKVIIDSANLASYMSSNTAGGVNKTVTDTNVADLLYSAIADNDYFRLRVGGTASNAGFVELATADDGNEPVYVRQYTGTFTTLKRTATLLDANGNTSFPGVVSATNFVLSTTASTTEGAMWVVWS